MGCSKLNKINREKMQQIISQDLCHYYNYILNKKDKNIRQIINRHWRKKKSPERRVDKDASIVL
jgi:hypothetical protein